MNSPVEVRQVQLALLLSESDVPFAVVGGTARFLRGSTRIPTDLDLVIAHADASLLQVSLRPYAVPTGHGRYDNVGPWRVVTSWSPVDVFLQDDLPTRHTVEIDEMEVRVADE